MSKSKKEDGITLEFSSKGRTVTTTPEGLRLAAKNLEKKIRTNWMAASSN